MINRPDIEPIVAVQNKVLPNVEIDGTAIGRSKPPYIIAELSANHMGSLDRAVAIVRAAAFAGADAIKLQTYTADSITIDSNKSDFLVTRGPRAGSTLYQVYSEGSTPWEWHETLFALGRELGITIFSAPFDHRAIDKLESINAPVYKIASCELLDLPLISYAAQTGKPLIFSTGMATLEEINEAVEVARGSGCRQLILLHCISGYPTPVDEAHLKTIIDLEQKFKVPVGFSDHTQGVAVSLAAVANGACVIEKHLTLSRADGGLDAAFSLEPFELARLCEEAKIVHRACGEAHYGPLPSEAHAFRNRRSLYVVEDIQQGEMFSPLNVRSIRPGAGLRPKYLSEILGKRAKCAVSRGTALTWEMVVP